MIISWIAADDGNTLCADGQPIRIRRTGGDPPFILEADGHQKAGYWSLASAKLDAERIAAEMDEFLPSVARDQ